MSPEPIAPSSVDLAIVGGGPAGVAAAVAGAELGLRCLIVERSQSLGGQIVAIQSKASGLGRDQEADRTEALCQRLSGLGIGVITDATVWNVGSSRVLHLKHGGSHHRVSCRALIVGTGARERPMPFLGWTLPGVITCGAAQRMLAESGVLPGHHVLVAGRGPLLLRAAAELIEAGVRVVALMEATDLSHMALRGPLTLLGSRGRAHVALRCARAILGSGAPVLFGQVIVEAGGNGQVEWVTTAPTNGSMRPLRNPQRTFVVDAICVSNGLEPNIELFQALGCELIYDAQSHGFFPRLDETLRTSVSLIYAAGEVTGIGGAAKSLVEGEIAGLQAALDLGVVPKEKTAQRLGALVQQRRKLLAQARWTESAYLAPDVFLRVANPDTIACRCEEITLGEVREAIREGDGSPRDVKLRTRLGMGMCQGRMCLTTLYRELASSAGYPGYSMEAMRVRPPLEPVPLGWLAEHAATESEAEKTS